MNGPWVAHRGDIVHLDGDPADGGRLVHHADGMLLVDDSGHLHRVGPARSLLAELPADAEVVDHGDALLLPGLVDTHIHFPQGDIIAAWGSRLLDWLERYTFPAEARFADPAVAAGAAGFFVDQLLANGTTTAMVFGSVHPASVDAFFAECAGRGLRMLCGKVMMDRNAPRELLDTPRRAHDDSLALIQRWHGRDRLLYAVTPRFAPTSTPEQLEVAGDLLRAHPGVRLQTHLSENTDECDWVARLFPERLDYVDVYEHHGLLGPRSVFAHALHLDGRERARLGDSGSAVAFCPCSNLFIGSGLFDLAAADAAGIRVGLGTDVGGGDSFSLLRTVNEAYKVLQLRRQNLSPERALYLATLGGARALGLDHVIGNFQPGKEADFIVLDPRATSVMARRAEACDDIASLLFATLMLGDDRAVRRTYALGRLVHHRDDEHG